MDYGETLDNTWGTLRKRTWHRSSCSDIAETSDEGTGSTSSPYVQCIKRSQSLRGKVILALQLGYFAFDTVV